MEEGTGPLGEDVGGPRKGALEGTLRGNTAE